MKWAASTPPTIFYVLYALGFLVFGVIYYVRAMNAFAREFSELGIRHFDVAFTFVYSLIMGAIWPIYATWLGVGYALLPITRRRWGKR